ncbi:MAG: hypothetical protein AAFQ53_17425, partial [Bacteroidota bacterium]
MLRRTLSLVAVALLLSACQPDTPSPSPDPRPETMTNKAKAIAVLESLENGNPEAISYINPETYIQHNLGVADGLEGFGMVMQNAPEGGFKARVVRAFEDGAFVVTHTEYDFFGPKIGFDIFRFE